MRRRMGIAAASAIVALAGLWPSFPAHAAAVAGQINTFAGGNPTGDGGAPTGAALNKPGGVAVDGAGTLYIADTQDNRIRKVAPGADGVIGKTNASGQMVDADDIITTVAGNGTEGFAGDGLAASAAELGAPQDVRADGAGNLWIADLANNRVRFVCLQTTACSLPVGAGGPTVATGTITTVAGTGTQSETGDGGAATMATLSNPAALAFDSTGNLYIADLYSHVIRFVCLQATACINANWYGTVSAGNIARLAGQSSFNSGDSGDGGPATSAGLGAPDGVAVDPASGNLYIAEANPGQRIRAVTASTGIITTLSTGPTSTFMPDLIQLVTAGGSSSLYIANIGDNDILRLNLSTLTYTTLAGTAGTCNFGGDGSAATSATLCQPDGVVQTAAGELFISDKSNFRVRKVNTNGVIVTVAGDGQTIATGDGGPATQAGLSSPWDVATDSAGDVFIADANDNRVRFVCVKTGGCSLPSGPVVQGNVTTVAGNGSGTESGDGGSAISAGTNFPEGVALDAAGNLYIADLNGLRVRFVCLQATACTLPSGAGGPSVASGNITTIAGTGGVGPSGDGGPATQARLNGPQGLAVGRAGTLFVADEGSQEVRVVCLQSTACALPAGAGGPSLPSGYISALAGQAASGGYSGDGGLADAAMLLAPEMLVLDAAGNIYIADTGNNAIRFVCLQTTICGSAFGMITSGTIRTIAGQGPNTAGFAGDGGPAPAATLNGADGLGADQAGDIFVTDGANNRVRFICMQSTCPDYLSPSGISQGVITTLAGNGTSGYLGDGGLANVAEMQIPRGNTLDAANDLFIADTSNNRIREVTSPVTLQPYPSPLYPSFALQAAGTNSPAQTVTLNNPTSASISVSSVAMSGSNVGDFGVISGSDHCSGTSVPAGGACTVQVVFHPGTATATNRSATLTFSDSGGATTAQTAGLVGTAAPAIASIPLTPSPVAAAASLAPNTTTTVTATAKDSAGNTLGGATMYLAFTATTSGGSAAVGSTALTATPAAFVANSSGQVAISYTTPATLPTGGEDIVVAQNAQSSPTVTAQDTYVFSKVTVYKWSRSPIASTGSLAAGTSVKLRLTAKNASGGIVAGTKVYLSFTQAPGGGSARVGTTALTATPRAFTTNSKGHIVITYTTPSSPPSSGTDTITAQDATTNPSVTAHDGYTY